MRISTGLRPESKAWKVPVGLERAVYDSPFGSVEAPRVALEVGTMWVIEFWDTEDLGHSPIGRHHHTMIATTEPKIEKKSVTYAVADETSSEGADEYYRERYQVPDDALREVRHFARTMHSDVLLNWYEVTL